MASIEEIIAVYQRLNDPNQTQESINQITEQLTQFYQNPESLLILLQLYLQNDNKSIRISCTTGFKSILNSLEKWAFYQQQGRSENIKQLVLHLLSTEKDPYLFLNAIYSFHAIIKAEYITWHEYLGLIQTFSANQIQIYFSLLMANALTHAKLDDDYMSNVWDFLCQLAATGLSSGDERSIEQSALLIQNLFDYDTFQSHLLELLSSLFQSIIELMNRKSDKFGHVLDCFNESILTSEFTFPNRDEILQQIFSVIASDNFDIEQRFLLFETPLDIVLTDREGNMDEMAATFFEIYFTLTSVSFDIELTLDQQENLKTMLQHFDKMSEAFDDSVLYQLLRAKGTGSNSPGEIVAYGQTLISLITKSPHLIIHDLSSLIEYGFACFEIPQPTMQENGFSFFEALFEKPNDAFNSIQNRFLHCTFNTLSTGHMVLINTAFKSLINYLDVVTLSNENIQQTTTILFQTLQNCPVIDIQAKIMNCFKYLIPTLCEINPELLSPLIPVIAQAATEFNLPEQVILKGFAIECLGILIKNVPQIPNIEQLLAQFILCIKSEDNMLITSGFDALIETVAGQIPQVIQVLPEALQAALEIVNQELEFKDDEDLDDDNNMMIDRYQYTCDFIEQIARTIPDSFQACYSQFHAVLANKLEDCDPRIERISLKALSTIMRVAPPEDYLKFLEAVANILDGTDNSKTAGLCFNIFAKFIQRHSEGKGFEVPDQYVQIMLANGISAMNRELQLQDNDDNNEYDIELFNNVYFFFKIVANDLPRIFPITVFWDESKRIRSNGVAFEQCEIIGVLATFYSSQYQSMHAIQKKVIIREFVDKLPLCDCYNPPDPIIALRIVVEREPNQLEQYMEAVIPFINSLLETKMEDQLNYLMTMECTVSLLFSLFKVIYKEAFDTQTYLPFMFSNLPATVAMEAANIYHSLVYLCGEYPQKMGPFAVQVITAIAEVFSLNDKEWKQISLPEDICRSMAVLLNNLISSMNQGQQILKETLTNESQFSRFQTRFQTFLATE